MARPNSYLFLFLIIGLTTSRFSYGQDSRVATQPVTLQVAGSALLAVSGPEVILKLAGATAAGEAIQDAIENDKTRLRISSIVNNGESRAISCKISEALVGTQLYVELKTPNSNFEYPSNMGTLKGMQLLSNESNAVLVEGIRTCWSGTQEDDGYVVKYTYKAIPNATVMKSANITVTYTISLVDSDTNK